jgi:hypothetical protein
MGVKGRVASGWTHHTPLRANSTILWSRRASLTRPSMLQSMSELPSPAGGSRVNSIDGATFSDRQPIASRHVKPSAPTFFTNPIDAQPDVKNFNALMLGSSFRYGSAFSINHWPRRSCLHRPKPKPPAPTFLEFSISSVVTKSQARLAEVTWCLFAAKLPIHHFAISPHSCSDSGHGSPHRKRHTRSQHERNPYIAAGILRVSAPRLP